MPSLTEFDPHTGDVIRHTLNEISAVDVERRRVPVCLSSETPVERYGGWQQILKHSPEAIDLSMLRDSALPAPFLLNHNQWEAGQQIGAVDPDSIQLTDGKLRATVVIGNGPLADQMLTDIANGIRRQVSVGGRILERDVDEKAKIQTITRWRPYEVSLVPIGADRTSGIARGAELGDNPADGDPGLSSRQKITNMPDKPATAEKTAQEPADIEILRESLHAEMLKRNQALADAISDVPASFKPRALELQLEAQTKEPDNQVSWLHRALISGMATHIAESAEAQKPADESTHLARQMQATGIETEGTIENRKAPAVLKNNNTYSLSRALYCEKEKCLSMDENWMFTMNCGSSRRRQKRFTI